MAKDLAPKRFWDTIKESDFEQGVIIEEEDIAEYNLDSMKIFFANVNCMRQIAKLMDGLKPVEKRILYTMYGLKVFATSPPLKCSEIVGLTMRMHPHGDGTIYKSLISLSQNWRKSIPLISIGSNNGSEISPNGYAQQRYVRARLSKFAQECFFENYDKDCVEMMPSQIIEDEPIQLPSKFPNILINGAVGMAAGNKMGIPSYHVEDIYKVIKRVMENPDTDDIYMNPEVPTGCDIVTDKRSLKDICETGTGVLRMRARIDIQEGKNNWYLIVRNLPWLVDMVKVNDKIRELVSTGKLPIKDIQDDSQICKRDGENCIDICYKIVISKAQDPYAIRNILYKNTELASSISIQFKIVTEDLNISKMGIKELIFTWLDERREYKRRLLNSKILKNSARINFLDILIEVMSSDNMDKTTTIIRNSTSTTAVDNLVNEYGMNTYQAGKIVDMRYGAFTKDTREKALEEKENLIIENDNLKEIIRSKKRIDALILDELNDMRKYGKERRCRYISVAQDQVISDTDHIIIITKKGYIKKLPLNKNNMTKTNSNNGTFLQGDFPIFRFESNNMDSIMMFDAKGRYSIISTSSIPNTEYNAMGTKLFEVSKLEGEIVYATSFISDTLQEFLENKGLEMNLVTISKHGYIKRTNLSDLKIEINVKNGRAAKLRDGDDLAFASILFTKTRIVVYTKNGEYTYMEVEEIPSMSKESQGLLGMHLVANDICIGCCAIGKDSDYLVMLTEKGFMKKIDLTNMNTKKRKESSYLCKVADNDALLFCNSVRESSELFIFNKTAFVQLKIEDVPTLSRLSAPVKVIPVPVGDNIISMNVVY